MAGGVPVLGTVTRRCEVEQTGPRQFRIVLTQGLNRQIRRMCEHLGHNVVRLKRRIMHMHLDVAREEWRVSPRRAPRAAPSRRFLQENRG